VNVGFGVLAIDAALEHVHDRQPVRATCGTIRRRTRNDLLLLVALLEQKHFHRDLEVLRAFVCSSLKIKLVNGLVVPKLSMTKNESDSDCGLMKLHIYQDSAVHFLADSTAQPQCRVPLASYALLLLFACGASTNVHAQASNSIARVWNERALAAIRVDTPHPPAQARNLFSLSVCMYDAWAAYDTNGAVGYVYRGKHTAADVAVARHEAISYAAYRILKERHAYSKTFTNTLAADDAQMTSLGYDTNNLSRDTSAPAGVGNSVYDAVSAWFINDGARQTNGTRSAPYPDYPPSQGGYVYINPALATALPGITDGKDPPHTVVDINHWQRLQIDNAIDQNGFPQGPLQSYLGAQWLGVRPFALARFDATKPWIDPGPPPYFGGASHTQFVKEVVAVITAASHLTPDDGVTIDISPGSYGNNSLDFAGAYGNGNFDIYDGQGYTNNPVTGLPYAPDVVKRGDFARLLAEFWADGPNSDTPPGHWNVLANYLTDHPLTVKRIGGVGPVVDDLEWDVKMYFALNAAVHEAACACWAAKRAYDGWRPISAIRYLGGLGQSTDPGLPTYNANGLPLITNLIELVSTSSVASGRHAGLTPGKIAVLSWPGPPTNSVNQHSGVKWIHADTWSPYQRTNFVTPAFPGYFSGHSTFSRSAAEILTAITGLPFFPGGLGTYTNYALGFENGPSQPITLQWATYYDAADQAGISRIWGGIHPPIDNLAGRRAGAQCGKDVWALARTYWDGSVINTPITLVLRQLDVGTNQIRFNTLRGFYCKVQSTTNLGVPFADEFGGPTLALDSSIRLTNTITGSQKFYRAAMSSAP
jgi:hypothetical protein